MKYVSSKFPFLALFIAIIFAFPAFYTPANAHHKIIRETIKTVSPAVVAIAAFESLPFDDFFEEKPNAEKKENKDTPKKQRKKGFGLGSGFIISADGLVVTNNHVVNSKHLGRIIIALKNGGETTAKIVGTDSFADIALLKMDIAGLPSDKRTFSIVRWGSSEKLMQGDPVIAIGAPFGLSDSVTEGVVSKLNRGDLGSSITHIQHDAAVNPGNSGGPLFNMEGEVIGINSSIVNPSSRSYAGISLAIPSEIAQRVVSSLKQFGRVKRGYIGTSVSNISPAVAEKLGLPNTDGVLIAIVGAGGPANRAGLKKGDVVLSWNGKRVKNSGELVSRVMESELGQPSSVEVWRYGKMITLSITPTERPNEEKLRALKKERQKKEEK